MYFPRNSDKSITTHHHRKKVQLPEKFCDVFLTGGGEVQRLLVPGPYPGVGQHNSPRLEGSFRTVQDFDVKN